MQRFVHLRLHTEYSLVDSLVRIDNLVEELPQKEMYAAAVTDFCNLFAAVKWYQKAISKGIKPLFGCDIPWHDPKNPDQTFSLILLCQNHAYNLLGLKSMRKV
jgi:DNA polymerase-3 subunit alpha